MVFLLTAACSLAHTIRVADFVSKERKCLVQPTLRLPVFTFAYFISMHLLLPSMTNVLYLSWISFSEMSLKQIKICSTFRFATFIARYSNFINLH